MFVQPLTKLEDKKVNIKPKLKGEIRFADAIRFTVAYCKYQMQMHHVGMFWLTQYVSGIKLQIKQHQNTLFINAIGFTT